MMMKKKRKLIIYVNLCEQRKKFKEFQIEEFLLLSVLHVLFKWNSLRRFIIPPNYTQDKVHHFRQLFFKKAFFPEGIYVVNTEGLKFPSL
jgi:hypothetical protein